VYSQIMENIKICFVKTHEDARLPERNNKEPLTGDTGYDVYAVEDALIPANGTANVPIGLDIGYITPGYWIRVESRSGMFFKHGITSFFGVIDCSYRGKLGISLINNTQIDYNVKKGDRIAQLAVYKLIEPETCWAESKDVTSRGDKGFGSSGR
jgi:deoxyuridine 5'-triphosphate nucleotidohydrolase